MLRSSPLFARSRRARARPAKEGTAALTAGRAADAARRDGHPLRREQKKDRGCRWEKRASEGRTAGRRRKKAQAERLAGGSLQMQVGRPGDPATRRPGDPATRRPGDPATRRPGDPATRRPGDPATRRPGDPATRRPGDPATIIASASSAIVKPPDERAALALPSRPSARASTLPVARSTSRVLSMMVIVSPPNLSPGLSAPAPRPTPHTIPPSIACPTCANHKPNPAANQDDERRPDRRAEKG